MNTITFDTNAIVNKLQTRGFTKDQAEGVIAVLTENEFVTLSAFEKQTLTIQATISDAKYDLIKWVAGLLVAQAAAIVALQNLIG